MSGLSFQRARETDWEWCRALYLEAMQALVAECLPAWRRNVLSLAVYFHGRAVFTGRSIEAGIGQHQACDGLAAHDVRFDDVVHVRGGDVSVPDSIGIDDKIRAVLALIEAARLIGADLALQSSLCEFLLEELLQGCLGRGVTASPRMSRRTLITADENVFLEFGHGISLILT